MSQDLRDRLMALAHGQEWYVGDTWGDALEGLALAAARLALEDAARECEQRWRDGYRGEVTVGFAHVVRNLAATLGDGGAPST